MRYCLAIIILAFLTVDGANAGTQCKNKQRIGATLPYVKDGSVIAIACEDKDDGGGGDIRIDILIDGKRKETLATKYVRSAYALRLDTSIRFDEGGSQGLGVSTGQGKDGTGMHYWKISKRGDPAVDLGDAPSLVPDRFRHGNFSALVTSSGKFQSIRYFYEVVRHHLFATSAVGFAVSANETHLATSMIRSPEGHFIEIGVKDLSAEAANKCMNGEIACW
jgi:hypothetical protein